VKSAFLDYYHCPESLVTFTLAGNPSSGSGYFRFGRDVICYGHCTGDPPAEHVTDELYDAIRDVERSEDTLRLTFNPSEIIQNLRYERYASSGDQKDAGLLGRRLPHHAYYALRPLLPIWMRRYAQRIRLKNWKGIPFPKWPVDATVELILERLMALLLGAERADRIPFIWFWPNGAPSCAIMTHDVESEAGRDACYSLMDLDDAYGVKSSFQIIPEGRYRVSRPFLEEIRSRGFEINIHDLNHDGHLFDDQKQFLLRAGRINAYGKDWKAQGFRSGVLYRNLDSFGALDFSYDMSVPSVGHLEAQRGGCCSVMPFFLGRILELPVTTTQDYSLFHILNQYSTALWKHQTARIMERHGLASFIAHPDYVAEARARDTYQSLLGHLANLRDERKVWIALPGEVNQWWRARSQMKLTARANTWAIEGPQSDRARVAYAALEGDHLVYEVEPQSDNLGAMKESTREKAA